MPSTSTTQTSATQKNTYRQLLSEAAASSDDGDDKSGGARDNVSAVIVRCNTLCHLVKMQQCPSCGCHTLEVRGVNCNLGIVCRLETFCTSCDNVISRTLSSHRLDRETSGNVPFVVTRSVVSASVDVGHSGIARLCRYLDRDEMHHTTFDIHRQVATKILSDAAKTVRRVYQDLDPSIGDHDDIKLTVSFDGSWMTRGHKSLYGVGCVVEVITGLVLDLTVLSLYCQSCACASAQYGGNNTAAFPQWHAARKSHGL